VPSYSDRSSLLLVISIIVRVYQALFLAHDGLTTLGANVFSMGICGPLLGYWV
jgi:cobalt/nickel transport system permease protein